MNSLRKTEILDGITKTRQSTSLRASQRKSIFEQKKLKKKRVQSLQNISNVVRPSYDAAVQEFYNSYVVDSSESTEDDLSLEHETYGRSSFSLDFEALDINAFQSTDNNILETEEKSEDTLEEFEYLQQNPIEVETVVLEPMQVPDIQDIKEDEIEEKLKIERKRRKPLDTEGRFFDPLSGKELRPAEIEMPTEIDQKETISKETDSSKEIKQHNISMEGDMQKDQPGANESSEEGSEDQGEEDFSELFKLDKTVREELEPMEIVQKIDEEALLTKIMIKEIIEVTPVDTTSLDEIIRKEEEKKLMESIEEFINDLIGWSVDYAEEVAKETLLRSRLDKRLLMKELFTKYQHIETETKTCLFLERKVVEHFFKKKAYNYLMPYSRAQFPAEVSRYSKSVEDLDLQLGILKETKQLAKDGIERARFDLIKMKERYAKATEEFETILWKILKRDDSLELKSRINKCLSVVKNEGSQLSKLRKVIIKQQHTLATYLYQLNKLTLMCGEIDLNDYEKFTSEIVTLGKKIEERNNDLNRLRGHLAIDMHFHAHIKEKTIMAKNLVSFNSRAIDELVDQCNDLKDELYTIGMERIFLQETIRKLLEKGSLMHRTSLLHEYDTTIDKIKDKKQLVQDLYKNLQELEDKYIRLKAQCKKK